MPLASPWVDILEQPTGEASRCQFVEHETLIKTHKGSVLSHLVHAFVFQLIERHVIEVVKRFHMNSRTLVWIGDFEARKVDLHLRTCVYSRYAVIKTQFFKGLHRSLLSPGLALDHRQNNQEHSFLARNGDTDSTGQQTKTTTFVDLED